MAIGRPVSNRYKVPQKQWSKWSEEARRTFNKMYLSLRPSMQWAFHHPEATPLRLKHWATTRWNVAWVAADIVNGEGHLGRVIDV